jgi:hypothetical protein
MVDSSRSNIPRRRILAKRTIMCPHPKQYAGHIVSFIDPLRHWKDVPSTLVTRAPYYQELNRGEPDSVSGLAHPGLDCYRVDTDSLVQSCIATCLWRDPTNTTHLCMLYDTESEVPISIPENPKNGDENLKIRGANLWSYKTPRSISYICMRIGIRRDQQRVESKCHPGAIKCAHGRRTCQEVVPTRIA